MRYDINKLFLEPGPCDGCKFEADCKTEEMACSAFSYYVLHGTFHEHTPRYATHRLFNKIFKEDDKALKNYLKALKEKQ